METKRINDIPGLVHAWEVDNMLLTGQPQENSFNKLKELGVKRIINFRDENEMDFSFEKAACKELGIEYIQLPIISNGELIAENCLKINDLLNEDDNVLIHCGTANRVAGWLMTYLPLKRGMDFEQASQIAMDSGLTKPDFIEQARKIVEINK